MFLYIYFVVTVLCFILWDLEATFSFLHILHKYIFKFSLRMADLHVRSYNTQGLQGIEKRIDIFECLKYMRQNIYCLQDTYFIKENEINVIDQ